MIKKLKVSVDGKTYDVTVETFDDASTTHPAAYQVPPPASPALVSSAAVAAPVAPKPSAAQPAAEGALVSPLAGKVVTIHVSVGDSVAAGAEVVTLEAMKMNTVISANAAGKVSRILVAAGDAVEEGQALVEFA